MLANSKACFFLLVLLILSYHTQGQSIVGTWQVKTKQISSGLQESYVFKADKSFEYRVNSDDGLQRIRAIGGTYTYAPGDLRLTIKYTREIVGGTIERSHFLGSNDTWSIEGGTVQTRPVSKPSVQYLNLEFVSPTVIIVDEGNKFYKVN